MTKLDLAQKLEEIEKLPMQEWDEILPLVLEIGDESMKQSLADLYVNSFLEISYDMACGKVQEEDFEFSRHVFKQLKKLSNESLWDEETLVYYYEIDYLFRHDKKFEAALASTKAIDLCKNWIELERPAPEPQKQLAQFYKQAYDFFGRNEDWIHAIHIFWKVIESNLLDMRWDLYLGLIIEVDEKASEQQKFEFERFKNYYEVKKESSHHYLYNLQSNSKISLSEK